MTVADRWPGRSLLVASLIPPGSSVIDLGAGAGGLEARLPEGCTYTGLDLPGFDMDGGGWPVGRYDVAVMAGVLEFSQRPGLVLRRLRRLAPMAVVTYCPRFRSTIGQGRVVSRDRFVKLARRAGYTSVVPAYRWFHRPRRPHDVWVLR